ncbi:MAG: hypothetical protein KAJ52_06410 [Sedimentisphaerales bacterium]|nr:hypothetical protein [Sedimentisphaerales bacterium]
MFTRKVFLNVVLSVIIVGVFSDSAVAGYVRGRNWADSVVSYTEYIQNSGFVPGSEAELMAPSTTWWVLGPSDADVDPNGTGNGYAWDPCDMDYVAGWRYPNQPHQEIVVEFDISLDDVSDANSVVIHMYCGPYAEASVWAATDDDPDNFIQIGTIAGVEDGIPGTSGYFYDARFNFTIDNVRYIKVHRETSFGGTGMFFDSFASADVIEPTSRAEVAYYGWCITSDLNKDCYVNLLDFALFTTSWLTCNSPTDGNCDHSSLPDPPPSICHGLWQSGYGIDADLNHDCYINVSDLAVFTEEWLECNDPCNPNCTPTW